MKVPVAVAAAAYAPRARGAVHGPAPAPDAADPNAFARRLDLMLAQPGGLTAAAAAAAAASTSPVVQARAADLEAAIVAANRALVGLLPQLVGEARLARLSPLTNPSLGNLVVASTPSPPGGALAPGTPLAAVPLAVPVIRTQAAFSLGLTVSLLDYAWRLPALVAAAGHGREAARAGVEAARRQAAADARLLYYGWVRAQMQVVVAEQAHAQATSHVASARHLCEAGAASRADVLRLGALAAASELFLARARDLQAVLAQKVRVAMHLPDDAPLGVGEDVRPPLAPPPAVTVGDLFARAWAQRAEVRALTAGLAAADGRAGATRAAALPTLAATGELSTSRPNPRLLPPVDAFKGAWVLGVVARWSPDAAAQAVLGGQAGDAEVARLRAEREQLRDLLRSQVMEAQEALHEADLGVGSAGRGLEAATESYRVRQDLFVNGRATSTEMADAESDLTRARLDAVGAAIEQRVARVRLAHVTGEEAP